MPPSEGQSDVVQICKQWVCCGVQVPSHEHREEEREKAYNKERRNKKEKRRKVKKKAKTRDRMEKERMT